MMQEETDFLFTYSPIPQLVIYATGEIIKSNKQASVFFKETLSKEKKITEYITEISKINLIKILSDKNWKQSYCVLHFKFEHISLDCQIVRLPNQDLLLALTPKKKERKLEYSLERNRLRFTTILENITVAILFVDTEGRHNMANRKFFELLGLSQEDLNEISIESISSKKSAVNFSKKMSLVHKGEISQFAIEHEFLTPNSSCVWTQLTFISIQENETNSRFGIISLTDISKRKETELLLKKNRLWIDEISAIVPAGMAVLDTAGNIKRINGYFTEKFGYTIEDVPTIYNWLKLAYLPENRKKTLIRWKTDFEKLLMNQSFPRTSIERIRCKNGKWKDISILFKIVNDRILAIFTDVSELKEKERELKELNSTKDKLFSIIAHDLKNPFNTLIGYSELLSQMWEEFTSEEQLNHVKRMENSAKTGHTLLENLLLWAKKQTSQIKFEPENINLTELFEYHNLLFVDQATKKGITLQFRNEKNLHVHADKDMLETILRNLIGNAIKFTYQGGIIEVFTSRTPEKVSITVQDNGIGISNDLQEKIFDLVDKPSSKGTSGETGTGIGLSLCKEFVEEHGGKLSLESTVGLGSSFTFNLPCPTYSKEIEK